MSVKKIFMTLIIIIACVMVGAFLLNVLLPNASNALVDQVENQLYRATGMKFDFNKNGKGGTNTNDVSASSTKTSGANDSGGGGAQVDGFSK